MESSGTPTPAAEPQQPPPPPPPPSTDSDKASGGWRALAVLLALALAFAGAVLISVMVDYSESPICEDVQTPLGPSEDCYDTSATQKTISTVLGWPGGVIAIIGALVGLYFAATGRRGRLLMQLTAAAIVLGAASIVVGTV